MSTHHEKPASPVAAAAPEPAAEPPSRPLPRRILIAEDNELARTQLHKALTVNPDLDVQTTSDGSKALQLLAENNFSLLITDLRMPKLDGMQLIQEIQKRRLPVTVIVTTGHGSIEGAVQALRMGAYDFLPKPIDLDNSAW